MLPDRFVRAFWEPYIESNKPTKFLYAEPLFFRSLSNERTYIRHTSVNTFGEKATRAPKALAYLRDKSKPQSVLQLEGCHTFVPAGAVAAMFYLISCLQTKGVNFAADVADREDRWEDDVVLLGTPETHPTIDDIEAPFHFGTTDDGVVFKRGTKEVHHYRDTVQEKPQGEKWVVVTRTWSENHPERAITVIATSRLSRAIQRVALRLTQEQYLEKLLTELQKDMERKGVRPDANGFPHSFQALYRVQIKKRRGGGDVVGKEFLERVEVYPQEF